MLLALLVAAAASTPPIAPLTNEFDSKGMTSLSFGFGVPSLPGSASVPGTTSPFAGPLLTLAPIVGASYFISDGTAIRAEFGFDAILSSGGGPAALTLGVGVRMYQLKRNHVAVFLQPSVVLARYRTVAAGVLDAAQALTFAAGAGV